MGTLVSKVLLVLLAPLASKARPVMVPLVYKVLLALPEPLARKVRKARLD
jgi:hypothetical protein